MLDPAASSSTSSDDAGADSGASGERQSRLENPATVKALQVVVIVLGVILVLGFVTVIGRIVYLVTRPAPPSVEAGAGTGSPSVPQGGGLSDTAAGTPARVSTPHGPLRLPLAPGTRIETMTLDGDRLAVAVSQPSVTGENRQDRRSIVVIDIRTGETIATIAIGGERTDATAQ